LTPPDVGAIIASLSLEVAKFVIVFLEIRLSLYAAEAELARLREELKRLKGN
jgi:hypothetical protein